MKKRNKQEIIHIMINIFSILAIVLTLILGAIGILSEIKSIAISGKLLAILLISYVYIISIDFGLLFCNLERSNNS